MWMYGQTLSVCRAISRHCPPRSRHGPAHSCSDWTVSARIREAVAPVPLYLAGGLRPTNVGEAIRAVRPFGIDVCSGVRTHGRLDEGLLRPFAEAMAAADAVSA